MKERKIFTRLFWLDATERAISTFAQVVLSIVGVFLPTIAITNDQELKVLVGFVIGTLPYILLAGLGGALLAIVKAVVAAYKADTDTASLVVDTKPFEK